MEHTEGKLTVDAVDLLSLEATQTDPSFCFPTQIVDTKAMDFCPETTMAMDMDSGTFFAYYFFKLSVPSSKSFAGLFIAF